MQILKNKNVMEIYGERYLKIEDKSKSVNKDIPYLHLRTEISKRLGLVKTPSNNFDLSKTLKFMLEEDIGDLSIGKFSIVVKDNELKEALEKKIKTKIIDDRFVLKFVQNKQAGKEFKIRQKIADIMRLQLDKYRFHVASLDLTGIWAFQDYMKDQKLDLLDDIQKDEKFLREIADQYFKEFITVQGVQKKIRATKYYEVGNQNTLILKEAKVF